MKRRLLIAAVFLLAGAVVNVAVAWGCAAWVSLFHTPHSRFAGSQSDGKLWTLYAREALGTTRFFVTRGLVGVVSDDVTWIDEIGQVVPSWVPVEQLILARGHQIFDARGWPLRSMYCEFLQHDGMTTDLSLGGVALAPRDRWRSISLSQSPRGLPLIPIWPGFAINTIFYAVVLWLLILGPFVLRRFIRTRRGLCPKCAYPMGESAVCSECGKALPRWALSSRVMG